MAIEEVPELVPVEHFLVQITILIGRFRLSQTEGTSEAFHRQMT